MTPVVPADLFPAIDAFTNPIRQHTDPDDNGSTWQTTPSIWDQLTASTARHSTNGHTAGMRSRPPISTDVLSLIEEVKRICGRELRDHDVDYRYTDDHQRDTPSELRAIHALLVPAHPADAVAWTYYLKGWRREALRVLGLIPPRIPLPRDARCIDCGARDVTEHNSYGEVVIAPALRLAWDDDGRITTVWCAACQVERLPADLHLIAAHLANLDLIG